ncbi:unnamed protein product [Medioppia subpectinata]|uniref:Beta-ketoacyl synthase-like N-terminal domain-containing protein n=1 Tax=Medioppia subpectinata TaxID=1979941 RepID=A0A7R9KG29_9ACAR|nr:unnamed protein product [Medioppia subpectinata]CAG2102744.1 unnamed protein product [Medioppia subpectinata]
MRVLITIFSIINNFHTSNYRVYIIGLDHYEVEYLVKSNSSAHKICVSGMSGRFPLSDTTDEFAKNLFDGVDMVTEDDSRWPLGLFNISNRMGKIHSYQNFDSGFFGLMGQTVTEMDPQCRLLLEVSYEAILDSDLD